MWTLKVGERQSCLTSFRPHSNVYSCAYPSFAFAERLRGLTRGDFSSQATFGNVWRHFGCLNWKWDITGIYGWRPGVLLNILQCIGEPPTELSGPQCQCAKAEKPCCRHTLPDLYSPTLTSSKSQKTGRHQVLLFGISSIH